MTEAEEIGKFLVVGLVVAGVGAEEAGFAREAVGRSDEMDGWAADGEVFDDQGFAGQRQLREAKAEFFNIQQVGLSRGIVGNELAVAGDYAIRRVVRKVADDEMGVESLLDGGDQFVLEKRGNGESDRYQENQDDRADGYEQVSAAVSA